MKRLVFGALVAGGLGLMAAGCTEDPLATLRGTGPKRLLLSASSLTVNVSDSVAVTVTVADEQGNPLPDAASATSSAPTIVSVSTSSGAPLPQSKFFVKGLLFGSGYVKVTAGGVTDSIKVLTYPASVTVTGTPDSLNSGSSVVLTATARDAKNQPMTGVSPFTWTSDDAAVASVTTPGGTSTVSGKLPGVATITVRLPGGANTTTPLRVVPAPFSGSLSAGTGGFGTSITATKGGSEPDFSANTLVTVAGHPAFVTGFTAGTITFRLPPVDSTGNRPLWFSNLGADGLATRTVFNMTTAGGFNDTGEPGNSDPATAPVMVNGEYFLTLHGACDAGVPTGPSDDCDDFYEITNSTGAPVNVDITLDWPDDADVDILWCDIVCFDFSDVYNNFQGATGANPEHSIFSLAAGATVRLWVNLYAAGSDPYAFVRVTASGIP